MICTELVRDDSLRGKVSLSRYSALHEDRAKANQGLVREGH